MQPGLKTTAMRSRNGGERPLKTTAVFIGAPGGYAGWRATAAFSRRFGTSAWFGAFVRYDNLHGAVFAPSPLVRRESTVTAGFGISWIFATSSQRVKTDD